MINMILDDLIKEIEKMKVDYEDWLELRHFKEDIDSHMPELVDILKTNYGVFGRYEYFPLDGLTCEGRPRRNVVRYADCPRCIHAVLCPFFTKENKRNLTCHFYYDNPDVKGK